MQITSVKTKEYLSGIPLSDFESLKAALMQFSGRTAQPSPTRQPGDITDLTLSVVHPYLDQFLETLFQDIESSIERCGSYNCHFDHNAPGRFFHTTVKVDRMPDRSYLLSLTAHYVGQEVESGLAAALGIDQSLWWSRIELTFEETTERIFEIDFAPIVERLITFSDRELDGVTVARAIAEGAKIDYETLLTRSDSVVIVPATDQEPGIRIQIDPASVGDYYENQFAVDGSTVLGTLREFRDDKTKTLPPIVHIIVDGRHVEGERPWHIYPILDLRIKDAMQKLTNNIAAAFNSSLD